VACFSVSRKIIIFKVFCALWFNFLCITIVSHGGRLLFLCSVWVFFLVKGFFFERSFNDKSGSRFLSAIKSLVCVCDKPRKDFSTEKSEHSYC